MKCGFIEYPRSFRDWKIENLDAPAFDSWMAKLGAKGALARMVNPARQAHSVLQNDLVEKRQIQWNSLGKPSPTISSTSLAELRMNALLAFDLPTFNLCCALLFSSAHIAVCACALG